MKHIKKFETTSALNTWKAAHSGVNPYAYFCIETGTTYYQNFVNNNGHDFVDLGLPSGALWAACNIGASSQEQLGSLFAWGEVTPKTAANATLENYRYWSGSSNAQYSWLEYYSKYTTDDMKLILEPGDDAAKVVMGGDWRMATSYDYQELVANTAITSTSVNGVDGALFTATNGNTLFIPYNNSDNSGTSSWLADLNNLKDWESMGCPYSIYLRSDDLPTSYDQNPWVGGNMNREYVYPVRAVIAPAIELNND